MVRRWLVLLLTVLILAGCGAGAPAAERIDLRPTVTLPAEPAASNQEPLRVAIAAVISPRETLVHYRELLDYIGAQVQRPIELAQRSTYAEVNDLIRTGQVDLAFVCTWAFVDGQMQFGMEQLVAPQVNGKAEYFSYLLVPAASRATSIRDLKGGVFAFTDPLSTTGRLVPVYWLSREGLRPETFFKQSIFTYSHDRAVMAVADGLVDGAAVDHLVYEAMVKRDPSLAHRVRVIRKSDGIGTPPVVVGPDVDPVLRAKIREVLLQMHETEQGRRILSELEIERWVQAPDAAYEPIRTMLRSIGRP